MDIVVRAAARLERYLNESAVRAIEKEIAASGIEAGERAFRRLRKDPQNKLYFDEGEMNTLGYRLTGRGQVQEGIRVFQMNVEAFPASPNVYDSLAEAYMRSGDSKRAARNYRKSLELNPGNQNAKQMLQKLEQVGK